MEPEDKPKIGSLQCKLPRTASAGRASNGETSRSGAAGLTLALGVSATCEQL